MTSIEGDMAMHMRMDAIMKMRNNKLDLLISTDVASRGLNIEVDVVFNYDLPSATNFNEYVS